MAKLKDDVVFMIPRDEVQVEMGDGLSSFRSIGLNEVYAGGFELPLQRLCNGYCLTHQIST